MANLTDLSKTHVNLAKTAQVDAKTQQRNAGRAALRAQGMPDTITIQLKNLSNADRVFSLFAPQHLDRAYARFGAAAAVITGYVEDVADITCDLPAGIDALRHKLKLAKAIVAAYGLKVSADANVDQYDKAFYFSQADGLQQTDVLVKDIATRVDANLQQRTQLIWPKIHQITDDCDFLATVKAGTTLVVVLQISEYPVVNFLPKAN